MIKKLWKVLKKTFGQFLDGNVLKLCASLSYYTVFSIGPLLLIIIAVIGFFFGGREAAQDRILIQMQGLLGANVVTQIDQILNNFSDGNESFIGIIVGAVILLLGATSVFIDMQDSMNRLWSVKPEPGNKWWKRLLISRLLSFSLVVSMGFLLLVSLAVSAILDSLSERLQRFFSSDLVAVFFVLNYLIVIVITATLFLGIYWFLPDARIKWKDAAIGSVFTAVLFVIGKFLITIYITNSSLSVTYGAAASIIILLAWVYYSSAILYLGAIFTVQYARIAGRGIVAKDHAVMLDEEKEILPSSAELPNR